MLAEKLHAQDSEKFADANHKPEIAVALTRFELFVGFKPFSELQEVLALKPLQSILPKHDKIDGEALRQTCHTLLTISPNQVSDLVSALREIPESELGSHAQISDLLGRLSAQYSEFDNGNLVATLLMNHMTLDPGEAVCVPADSIHAWLSGDILECMARSDNVLNTGFCPRADRDNIDLFTQALTFNPQGPTSALLPQSPSAVGLKGKTSEFAPPFNEFNVLSVGIGAGEEEEHSDFEGPSLLVVTEGNGTMETTGDGNSWNLEEGSVYFTATRTPLRFFSLNGLKLYRAYALV